MAIDNAARGLALKAQATANSAVAGGSGTVTSVSVTTAAGVSGSVATATTTPAITVTLGAITPTSVAATGNVTGANLSGTNTGDQNLAPYALIASPTFTGTPAAPTATADTSSTQLATTAFVQASQGVVSVATTGGTTNLSAAQCGGNIIILTGVLASNATINFSSGSAAAFNRDYTIVNNCTGLFTVTLQACATGPSGSVTVPQGAALGVYTNGATIGKWADPISVLQSGVASSALTGTTGETTITTVTLPKLGPNDAVIIESLWSHSGSAGTWTPKVKIGSTIVEGNIANGAAVNSANYYQRVCNRGATNSQVFYTPLNIANQGSSTALVSTGAEETGSGATLTFTGTLANSGDSMKLESYTIRVVRG